MSVKVCPKCKNHSIVNNEETYKFCPECGQAIELECSVRAENKDIETNPESITIIDRNGIPHRLFVGYNISEENMERIKEIYGDGK